MGDPTTSVREVFVSSSASIAAMERDTPPYLSRIDDVLREPPSISEILQWQLAEREIEAKAAQLGGLAGAPVRDMEAFRSGYGRAYQGCDIYYGKDIGAHEVHGEIRAKYNALSGANGVLGLPVTDETGTPDGFGRYNHFQGGSIYWAPTIGPMMVRGPIRDVWAAQGWERGSLGYPIADEHRLVPLNPTEQLSVAWSLFENGAIVQNSEGTYQALAAEITPDDLRRVLRTFFDREIHKSPENIGLQPQVETTAVSGYQYGFWRALSRMVTFRLHGFRDNGLLPDTDFELDVRLRFSLTWPMSFTEPASKTLVAALDWVSVTAHGIASGTIADGVADGVKKGFFRGGPDPDHPEVPDGAVFIASVPTGVSQRAPGNVDVVDVLVTSQGGLQVLVPVGPIINGHVGNLRQVLAENAIRSLVEG